MSGPTTSAVPEAIARMGRIHHVAVVVRDLDAAVGFYRDTLGMPLELVLPVGSNDAALRVKNTLLARYVGSHPLRAAVRVELANGQVFHRRVTGITELDGQTEAVGLDSALGVIVTPNDIRRLMWMSLARLDADALEIHYETDSVARLQATFRMVQQ